MQANPKSTVLRLGSSVRSGIEKALKAQFGRDRAFPDDLRNFVARNAAAAEDVDEEDEDEDDAPPSRAGNEAAFDAYSRAIRALALTQESGRQLGKGSRNARLVEWLGERRPSPAELASIGKSSRLQSSLRSFTNPVRRYVQEIPKRYRRFRREREGQGTWYDRGTFKRSDLAPLEADVIVLAMVRAAKALLRDVRVTRRLDEANPGILERTRELFRTQVVVDEAADFSPVQLACMAELCDPAVNSFVACGDFDQRITAWGSRSEEDLRWVFPDIDIRRITVSYRHSRRLNELAHRLALLSSPSAVPPGLPMHIDGDGVAPACGFGLAGVAACSAWLAKRIAEVERLTSDPEAGKVALPTIAVLVCSEEEVGPLAAALGKALAERNIKVVACPDGQHMGQDNAVRVFDVRHIKGLEFEAVFFVGLDRLAEREPTLFEKYVYVGATRAATYLGLTIDGDVLPERIVGLNDSFCSGWSEEDLVANRAAAAN